MLSSLSAATYSASRAQDHVNPPLVDLRAAADHRDLSLSRTPTDQTFADYGVDKDNDNLVAPRSRYSATDRPAMVPLGGEAPANTLFSNLRHISRTPQRYVSRSPHGQRSRRHSDDSLGSEVEYSESSMSWAANRSSWARTLLPIMDFGDDFASAPRVGGNTHSEGVHRRAARVAQPGFGF